MRPASLEGEGVKSYTFLIVSVDALRAVSAAVVGVVDHAIDNGHDVFGPFAANSSGQSQSASRETVRRSNNQSVTTSLDVRVTV